MKRTKMMVNPISQSQTERDTRRKLDANAEEALEPMFRIIIHNDNVTPIDFVIVILMRIFKITPIFAEHITMTAHHKGIAYVTSLPKTEAERKVGQAHFAASLEGYPLTFTIEPE